MATNNSKEYIVLDTIAASAADLTLDAGKVIVGNTTVGKIPIVHKTIRSWKKQAKVAEVLQISTGTPTAANSTEYWINIRQEIDGEVKVFSFRETSAAAATPTTIVTQFKTVINGNPQIKVTASGTTTLVLTADVGYAKFTVTSSSNIAWAATQAGVIGVNTGALLYAAGFTSVNTSNNYTSYEIGYEETSNSHLPTAYEKVKKTAIFFLNEADTDCADLVTAMDLVGTAEISANVGDPDALAVA